MKEINSSQIKTGKLSVLIPLAIPIFFEQILRNLMGTVNTFMLSRISDEASAAVGVANQILNFVFFYSTMITCGAVVIVSQHLGAGKRREAGQIMMNSITMCILSGLIVSSIIVFFARQIVTLMGLEKALIADASVYLRILGITCFFQCLSTLISGFSVVTGRRWCP